MRHTGVEGLIFRSPGAGAALLGAVSAAAAAAAGAAVAAAAVAGGALRGALPGLPWTELDAAAAGAKAQLPGVTALAGSETPRLHSLCICFEYGILRW